MNITVIDGGIPPKVVEEVKKFDMDGCVSSYLNDPFTFTTGLAISGGKIIAVGVVRVINEIKIVIDPSIHDLTKARALKLLLDEAPLKTQCNEVVAVITQGGNHYVNILKNHYEFKEDYGVFLRRGI